MSASDGASVAAQLTGAGGQQAQIPKTETSKDVQNERRQTFKRRHGFLVGFFTLILYACASPMAIEASFTYS
jgi:phosphatidylinositol glycan class O